MSIVYTERFQNQISDAFQYGVDHFGAATAQSTYHRILSHIETTLHAYPCTGRWRDDIKCFHAWIPRTPFVVFYRVTTSGIEVLALFHHARDTASLDFN
jgi:plasmid stabilization system protein ParE